MRLALVIAALFVVSPAAAQELRADNGDTTRGLAMGKQAREQRMDGIAIVHVARGNARILGQGDEERQALAKRFQKGFQHDVTGPHGPVPRPKIRVSLVAETANPRSFPVFTAPTASPMLP